jgi:capsular exopolysaccharide synthesis family protein
MMSLLGGLMTAMLLAIGIDALDNKIYTEEDAIQITGLPVLTHIPLVSKGSTEPMLISSTQTSTMLESFRMLRTQLSFISSYGHMHTLVVTSSQPGEGKSTVAANLAAAFALNGKKVILVDTDLRRPRVHTVFGVENTQGFTTVVAGQCTLDEALQPSGVEGLQLLTSGPMPPNPPELLDSRAARDCINYMKSITDYVIIDAPPAHLLADAQIVATMSDGVLLVVSCQEARRGAVERTCELMAQTGVKIVGMVLNKFTSEQGGYYDYDYAGYRAYLDVPHPADEKAIEPVSKKI